MKEVADTAGTLLELEELLELDELPLLPQAASIRAALPATAVSPALLVTEDNETTSLVSGTHQDTSQPGSSGPSPLAGT
ncbi:MAG: hypothetical protein ACLQDY_11145 [Streptosporangiaceae bacterium]